MGILSSFCVAAAALAVDRVFSAQNDTVLGTVARCHPGGILVGAGLLMGAALSFYLQRSDLAYFYGAVCLTKAQSDPEHWSEGRWLTEIDSWATWLPYRCGFACLALTSLTFGYILYFGAQQFSHAAVQQHAAHAWATWLLSLSGFFVLSKAIQLVLLSTYRYEERPYRSFCFSTFLSDWKNREKTVGEREWATSPEDQLTDSGHQARLQKTRSSRRHKEIARRGRGQFS